MVAGIGLVDHHRRYRMAAVAAELLGEGFGRKSGIRAGDVELPPLLAKVDGRRLVGRERYQRGQERGRRDDLDRPRRYAGDVIFLHVGPGPLDRAPVFVEHPVRRGGVVAQLVYQLAPRPAADLRCQGRKLGLGLLLQTKTVAPKLGWPSGKSVLEMESAPELLLP